MNRDILREIGSISRVVAAMREHEFSKYGLKRGQHAFLTRIVENPGISQKDLSSMLKVDKGTTAKAIKKLIEEDYVTKEKSKNNYKIFEVFPTSKGKILYPKLIKEIKRTGNIALHNVEVNIEVLYKELSKMRKNLEIEWNNTSTK